MISQTQAKPST